MTIFNSSKRRVKTPTLIQMEATECGAAALGIILGYHSLYIPLEQLRIACGVSRDGSKAVNMLKAARNYELKASGAKMDMDGLQEIPLPAIAFWEFNHFVVIEGYDSDKIYLNDPATGPRTVTYQDFDRAFTGVVLIFSPTARFEKSGSKFSLLKTLVPQIKKFKDPLIFIISFSLVLVIPGVMIPGFTKIFVDDVLIKNMGNWLLPLLWGIVLTGVLRTILSYLQQYYLLRLELKINLTSAAYFVWHLLRLPFSFFSQRYAGDLQSRVDSNDRLARWLSGDLSISAVSFISMIFYGIILLLYDLWLGIIGILFAIANGILLLYVSEQLKNNSYRLQQELGKLTGVEMNGLQAIETIKATSSEDAFFQRWAGYHAQTLLSQQKIQLAARVLSVIPQLLASVLTVVVLGLGGWRVMQGYLTIGGLVAFQSLLMSFNAPLMSLLGVTSELQQLRGDLARLADVNKHPEDPRFMVKPSAEPKIASSKLKGKLQLSKLTFGYSPLEPPLLDNMELLMEPGKQIAIVGHSGSGKSTIAKLICGLYQPWTGEILWDDQVYSEVPLAQISKSLAFVDQDIFLFEGSIRDNLTLWDKSVPLAAIERAIVDAELVDVIAQRPNGLHSEVANAGENYSGGQRQQLEIARALTLEPTILVLDEASASLDAITEFNIMQNIKKRGISVVIIAHRLSAIRDSDEIIVMEQGKVVERGKHDALVQQQGKYYRLMRDDMESRNE